jgi:hypothetical protein
MDGIRITTTGEIHLNGDLVGRIQWLKPFVESDVAGVFTPDDEFVDEWGARINCSACTSASELLEDLDRETAQVDRKICEAIRELRAAEFTGEKVYEALGSAREILIRMDFDA